MRAGMTEDGGSLYAPSTAKSYGYMDTKFHQHLTLQVAVCALLDTSALQSRQLLKTRARVNLPSILQICVTLMVTWGWINGFLQIDKVVSIHFMGQFIVLRYF